MTVPEHMIARCEWQTRFDHPASGVALQNAISQWSQQVMPTILTRFFDRHCPATERWRIASLELDLGTIDLATLDETLAQRFEAALEEALSRAFHRQEVRFLPASVLPGHAVAGEMTDLDALRWFLLHGTSPWWRSERLSLLPLVAQLLQGDAQPFTQLIRDVGQREVARRRMAWQWSDKQIRQTIRRLEPWHAGFICHYADRVIACQQQQRIVLRQDSGFSGQLWYWILTHLLVERGSLFNTRQFVRATLWQMAQHYQLDFRQLVAGLAQAVERLQISGRVAPLFLQVLADLQHEETREPAPAMTQPNDDDLWFQFQRLLHHRADNWRHNGDVVHLAELLAQLAAKDRARTAGILREEGRASQVRDYLLQRLSTPQLAQLVAVLEPRDHRFIMTHITRTQALLRQRHQPRRLIWEVLLAWLLVNSGSHFSRRQFVQETLMAISARTGMDYVLLLTMLMQAAVPQPHPGHFELLVILHELVQQQRKRHHAGSHRWQPLRDYLRYGRFTMGGQPNQDATSRTALIALRALLLMPSPPGALLAMIRQSRTGSVDEQVLARRLLAILTVQGEATLSTLHRLMRLLSPDLSAPALALLDTLRRWNRQGRLTQSGVTVADNILVITLFQALFGHAGGALTSRQWLSRVWTILARQTATTIPEMVRRWQQNARTDRSEGKLDAALYPLAPSEVQRPAVDERLRGATQVHLPRRQVADTLAVPDAASSPERERADQPDEPDEYQDALTRWLISGVLPARVMTASMPVDAWLHGLIRHDLKGFRRAVAPYFDQPAVRYRLQNHLSLVQLCEIFTSAGQRAPVSASVLRELCLLLPALPLPFISQAVRQALLLAGLLEGWLTRAGEVNVSWLINQLCWRLLRHGDCTVAQLRDALSAPGLPASHSLRYHLEYASRTLPLAAEEQTAIARETLDVPGVSSPQPRPGPGPMVINNAGIVLLQSYIKPLFERLKLIHHDQFVNASAQRAATHYLQYLICGQSHSEEHHLMLNKVLCGLPLAQPLEGGIEINSNETEIVHSLIQAVAQYWPAIGTTSVAGFQGNWLVRGGTLTEKSEHWDLVVERRAYDILIRRSSLSYTIVRLPWMGKPIYVTWPI